MDDKVVGLILHLVSNGRKLTEISAIIQASRKISGFFLFTREKAAIVMQMTEQTKNRNPKLAPLANSLRRARRFSVTWPVIVRGIDRNGRGFQEFSYLKNLSPTGAYLSLARALTLGDAIEMDVRTPLSRRQWLRYFGRIVRIEQPGGPQTIGISFESVKPTFVPALALLRLRQNKARSCSVH
ncbi:MAG: PilZ domain-containing protein [Blastocatellia bacterium]